MDSYLQETDRARTAEPTSHSAAGGLTLSSATRHLRIARQLKGAFHMISEAV